MSGMSLMVRGGRAVAAFTDVHLEVAIMRARSTLESLLQEVRDPRNTRFQVLNESELADLEILVRGKL